MENAELRLIQRSAWHIISKCPSSFGSACKWITNSHNKSVVTLADLTPSYEKIK